MGVGLGSGTDFFQVFSISSESFLFFLIPTVLSVAAVYLLTKCFMDGAGEKGRMDAGARRREARNSDPMVFMALGALILGIGCGAVPILAYLLSPLSTHAEWPSLFSDVFRLVSAWGFTGGSRRESVSIM